MPPPPPLALVLIPPLVPSPRYSPGVREHGDMGHRQWTPKMDFPKFDGNGVKVCVGGMP